MALPMQARQDLQVQDRPAEVGREVAEKAEVDRIAAVANAPAAVEAAAEAVHINVAAEWPAADGKKDSTEAG